MNAGKDTLEMLSMSGIQNNPALMAGMSQKDIAMYEKLSQAFGTMVPVVVGASENGIRILEGQAKIFGSAKNLRTKVPALIVRRENETDEMKLSLYLSVMREEGGAISEGELINALIREHGEKPEELRRLLGKSKAWISKRRSLATDLSGSVKEMVKSGVICPRTAEEISKLPKEEQYEFARNVAGNALSKTAVAMLVSAYTNKAASASLRDAVIHSPLAVLDTIPVVEKVRGKKSGVGVSERLTETVRLCINLIYNIKGYIASAQGGDIARAAAQLATLREAVLDLNTALAGVRKRFPGETDPKEVECC